MQTSYITPAGNTPIILHFLSPFGIDPSVERTSAGGFIGTRLAGTQRHRRRFEASQQCVFPWYGSYLSFLFTDWQHSSIVAKRLEVSRTSSKLSNVTYDVQYYPRLPPSHPIIATVRSMPGLRPHARLLHGPCASVDHNVASVNA